MLQENDGGGDDDDPRTPLASIVGYQGYGEKGGGGGGGVLVTASWTGQLRGLRPSLRRSTRARSIWPRSTYVSSLLAIGEELWIVINLELRERACRWGRGQ